MVTESLKTNVHTLFLPDHCFVLLFATARARPTNIRLDGQSALGVISDARCTHCVRFQELMVL